MKKAMIVFMSILLLFVSIATPASANVDARAAIMVDATSGQVIYQQNADERLPVASISKLLTMAVIRDELEDGQISLGTEVKVTPSIWEISNDPNYSGIHLKGGQSYPVEELIQAAMVKSADGAAMALALAGNQSVTQFNAKMKAKARQIGMSNVKIVNPVGLTNQQIDDFKIDGISNNAENEMTARDVAILARYLIQTYPELLQVTSQKQASFHNTEVREKNVKNLNQMLPGCKYTVSGVTINGLKTGTSDNAGACFVSSGKYMGHEIITVILHANGQDSDNRFRQTQALYQMLKDDYQLQTIKVPHDVRKQPITKAKPKAVSVSPAKLQVWTQEPLSNYTVGVELNHSLMNHRGELKAPVKENQQIGKITFSAHGIQSINGGPLTYPLKSEQTVPKLCWLARLF